MAALDGRPASTIEIAGMVMTAGTGVEVVFSDCRARMRDVFGPMVDLPAVSRDDRSVAIIRIVMPTGTVVPLHSHSDPETLIVIDGELTAWLGGSWSTHHRGDIVEIHPDARHALRNVGRKELAMVLVTTQRMNRFFDEISAPADGPVGDMPDRLAHFAATAQAFGYWNGGPEDQRRVGIELPPSA